MHRRGRERALWSRPHPHWRSAAAARARTRQGERATYNDRGTARRGSSVGAQLARRHSLSIRLEIAVCSKGPRPWFAWFGEALTEHTGLASRGVALRTAAPAVMWVCADVDLTAIVEASVAIGEARVTK